MNLNVIKLARMILHLGSVKADQAELIYEGELLVGTEVFVEKDGEIEAAADDEYTTEECVIVVKDGKVEELRVIAPEEPKEPEVVVELPMEEATVEPEVVEPTVEEEDKEAIITELEERLAAKDEAIAVLEAKVKELEEKLAEKEEALHMSADKPAKEKIKEVTKVSKNDAPLANWGKH